MLDQDIILSHHEESILNWFMIIMSSFPAASAKSILHVQRIIALYHSNHADLLHFFDDASLYKVWTDSAGFFIRHY